MDAGINHLVMPRSGQISFHLQQSDDTTLLFALLPTYRVNSRGLHSAAWSAEIRYFSACSQPHCIASSKLGSYGFGPANNSLPPGDQRGLPDIYHAIDATPIVYYTTIVLLLLFIIISHLASHRDPACMWREDAVEQLEKKPAKGRVYPDG